MKPSRYFTEPRAVKTVTAPYRQHLIAQLTRYGCRQIQLGSCIGSVVSGTYVRHSAGQKYDTVRYILDISKKYEYDMALRLLSDTDTLPIRYDMIRI